MKPHLSGHLAQTLSRRGHRVIKRADSLSFGRGQFLLRNPESGVLCGGTEPRTDAALLGW